MAGCNSGVHNAKAGPPAVAGWAVLSWIRLVGDATGQVQAGGGGDRGRQRDWDKEGEREGVDESERERRRERKKGEKPRRGIESRCIYLVAWL